MFVQDFLNFAPALMSKPMTLNSSQPQLLWFGLHRMKSPVTRLRYVALLLVLVCTLTLPLSLFLSLPLFLFLLIIASGSCNNRSNDSLLLRVIWSLSLSVGGLYSIPAAIHLFFNFSSVLKNRLVLLLWPVMMIIMMVGHCLILHFDDYYYYGEWGCGVVEWSTTNRVVVHVIKRG